MAYRLSREQEKIKEMVYTLTPIDIIVSTQDLPNGMEVSGYAGKDSVTYRFYDDGRVIKK